MIRMSFITEAHRQALYEEMRPLKPSGVRDINTGGKADEQIQHSPSDYQRGTGSLP